MFTLIMTATTYLFKSPYLYEQSDINALFLFIYMSHIPFLQLFPDVFQQKETQEMQV